MPNPFSNDDLDTLLGPTSNGDEVEYESILDDDDDAGDLGGGQPQPQPQPGHAPAAPIAPDLTNYLADDIRMRQEEARRRAEQEQQQRQQQQQEQQRQQQEARQRQIDERLGTVFQDVPELSLTAEERQRFQESLPMIERLAEHHAARRTSGLRDVFREALVRNAELEDRLTMMEQATQNNPRQQLDMMVRSQLPDIDDMMRDPAWAQFRDRPIDALGTTPGQLINMHYSQGNAQGVVKIVNLFKDRNKTTRQETPAPGVPAGSGPSSRPANRVKMLRHSELNEAYARHQQGTLSYDKLQAIVNKFEDAAAHGRVDFDK